MSWRTELDGWFGCHLWRGSLNSSGYPTHWGGGRPRQAYIVAWERCNGPLPEGKEVDHLCRRILCVAPYHLEAISRNENQRRKFWSHRSQQVACLNGHDLKIHGRRTPEGGVVCRICSGVWNPTGPEPEPEME